MKTIYDLQQMGFTLSLRGDAVTFRHDGHPADPGLAAGLLDHLRRHRADAIAYLRGEAAAAQIADLLDRWAADAAADDATYATQVATIAIDGGLPFYLDGRTDAGADGWRWYTGLYTAAADSAQDDPGQPQPQTAAGGDWQPDPLPWER